ncbi:unnamed protein product [Microthlaspi erraticum]|uniref:Helitron helicase-like domain-containing protein n=1 Tax=Microthlaspi erraticum TaxID=1685480 RepID=A0A6D2L9L1_9BRAS|nr:unnamed protein product [Microthlaspi erraticum]
MSQGYRTYKRGRDNVEGEYCRISQTCQMTMMFGGLSDDNLDEERPHNYPDLLNSDEDDEGDYEHIFQCSSPDSTDTEDGDNDKYQPSPSHLQQTHISEQEPPSTVHIVPTLPESVITQETVQPSPTLKKRKRVSMAKKKETVPDKIVYNDEGDMTYSCVHCGAKFWHFQKFIRIYNMLFSMTSLGGKTDHSIKKGKGPNMFQLHGENYHLIGSMLPNPGDYAKFYQMYIVDSENELDNRLNFFSKGKHASKPDKKNRLRKDIIDALTKMLDDVNPYVKNFRTARERFNTNPEDSFHMRIISDRVTDGKLRRISEIHPAYIPLQYPLGFSYGEDGFRLGIKKANVEASKKTKKENISVRQFFAYRLMVRPNESNHLLHSRRLFQQYLVDTYTMIESNRLSYLRLNQTSLRSDSYDSIKQAEDQGVIEMDEQGNKFLLPASFTGGPRYMRELYFDAMAICRHHGFPDLFITFTCNPKWTRLSPTDRAELITRELAGTR